MTRKKENRFYFDVVESTIFVETHSTNRYIHSDMNILGNRS